MEPPIRGSREVTMPKRIASFQEFWPYYVAQHSHPVNRALHFLGTSLAVAALTAAPTLGSSLWVLAAPVAGYGCAWVGHFFFEKNRPATFTYPLWSLRGDLRMYRLMWMSKMEPELSRARSLYPAGA
jgi:hypothetical protein